LTLGISTQVGTYRYASCQLGSPQYPRIGYRANKKRIPRYRSELFPSSIRNIRGKLQSFNCEGMATNLLERS
jgi:hypothetical protein